MPELPEVETYVRDLADRLPGRVFRGVHVHWPNQLPRNTADQVGHRLRGQTVRSVGRRGKYIVLQLDHDWLLVHLKMSGRLQLVPQDEPANPHAHVVFLLEPDRELRFHDPRKFGRVYVLDDPAPVLSPLGPEPLSNEFTVDAFRIMIDQRRGRLKPLLLNQSFIAGLGNIYVDESLWAARLHPLRTADTLTGTEVHRLHGAIRDVLQRAVARRGTSFSEMGYRDLTGNMGEMQGSLSVFRRTDEPCPRCDTPIVRLVVGARGTHVCPQCQPPPDP